MCTLHTLLLEYQGLYTLSLIFLATILKQEIANVCIQLKKTLNAVVIRHKNGVSILYLPYRLSRIVKLSSMAFIQYCAYFVHDLFMQSGQSYQTHLTYTAIEVFQSHYFIIASYYCITTVLDVLRLEA